MDKLPFPETIDFQRACALKSHYQGTIPESCLERLAGSTLRILQPASADFRFFEDLQGLMTIRGSVTCEVELTCERCGEPFACTLCAEFCSSCDKEKARSLKLTDRIDLVELNAERQFELLQYLEDCLLLEIPYAPRHEPDDPKCKRQGSEWTYGKIEENLNPFEILQNLKGKDEV